MSSIKLELFDSNGQKLGDSTVPAGVFACEQVPGLLHQAVRWQRAKLRAGTHRVLTRAEVRGGGKKPWRQKGLGRARAGSNTSPVWVGGGVAHGPKPRSYQFHVNKKERRRALGNALSARAGEGKCIALKDFALDEIKTREAKKVLQALGISSEQKTLVVLDEQEQVALKSLRNLAHVKALPVGGLNVYDILEAASVVITQKALERLSSTEKQNG